MPGKTATISRPADVTKEGQTRNRLPTITGMCQRMSSGKDVLPRPRMLAGTIHQS